MNPKDREKEVMEYLEKEFFKDTGIYKPLKLVILEVVRAILRRYELYDVEDMPRGE